MKSLVRGPQLLVLRVERLELAIALLENLDSFDQRLPVHGSGS